MKIEIKPFCMEYAAELSKALNNKKILDNLRDGISYPYTVKDAEDYISFILVRIKTVLRFLLFVQIIK